MGMLSQATRSAALGVLAIAACLALSPPPLHADRRAGARRAQPVEPRAPEEPAPRAPVAPPIEPPDTHPPRSAFASDAPGRAPLTLVARRPGGLLVGDHAIAFDPYAHGGTWSSVSLTSGTASTFPAPLRVIPSGTVGVLAENVWPAGDVLVAHDGRRAMLIRTDGTFAPGETRPRTPWILGTASIGSRVIVWWRLDATRTELEALDRETARTLWRQPGPPWGWDAHMAADDARVALLSARGLEMFGAESGAHVGGLGARALREQRLDTGWPHPFALGRGMLVVGTPSGAMLLDGDRHAFDALSGRTRGLPSILAADDTTAFAVHGPDLVAADLVTRGTRWIVRVAPTASLHLVPWRTATHLVVCDADGGAIVLHAATGIALLRVGVGGCTDARALTDGTIAIAGARETWIVGPAATGAIAPARSIDGTVTLDGAPAAGLPVLINAGSYPLDGVEGCPPIPAYARCVLTDDAGRFRATVRAHGLVPVTVDLDAAANRAGRPRAIGGSVVLDGADAAEPLRLEVRGADPEL